MKKLTITVLLLVGGGIWNASSTRAQTPPDPAADQISFISLYDCVIEGGAYDDYPPPCSQSALMDADGSHVILNVPPGVWSPDGTKVLQSAWVSPQNVSDIYVTNVIGATWTNLTNHPADDRTPAWSPDGTRIAFASDRDGLLDLYVMNPDGSNVVRINTGAGMAWAPTWSPDGSRLGFACIVDLVSPDQWSAVNNVDICAINADGSGFARLTSEPEFDYDPSWSPDGSAIVFVRSRDYATEIVVMGSNGGPATEIMPGRAADGPSWSRDGTRILFVDSSAWDPDQPWMPHSFVAVVNADGTGLTWLAWGYFATWRHGPVGSNEPPLASFTFDCTGLMCTFDGSPSSDSDGTIAEYLWQFGDGTTGSGSTATHVFGIGQVYGVRLTVLDDLGGLGTSFQVVDINRPPSASFTATCNGLTCALDGSASFDPDGTISYFLWEFGDGTAHSGPATITHTYAAVGSYVIKLSVTDNASANDTNSQSVTVSNTAPVAAFTSACSNLTCSFNAFGSADPDGTIVSYAWSFGDGITSSGASLSHSYTAAGTYSVILTVTDNGAASSSQTQSVTVVRPKMHVGDLDRSITTQNSTWSATVIITIHDANHGGLPNATAIGSWNDIGGPDSCITNAGGQCAISRAGIPKKTNSVTFSVTSTTRAPFEYTPAVNHDADGDSNGTSISVQRP
jgi:PKD repeat protein